TPNARKCRPSSLPVPRVSPTGTRARTLSAPPPSIGPVGPRNYLIHFVSARRLRALRIRRPRAERPVITCRVRTPSCSRGGRDDQERAAREGTEKPGQGSTHRRARPPRSARLVLPGRHGRHREDRQGRPGAEDCCQSRQEEVDPLASRTPAMSLYLQPDVELTADDGSLLLSRRGVPVAHVLGVGEAVALSWLGHTGSFDAA